LLWHVVSTYRSQGFDRFIFLTGYLGEQISAYTDTGKLPDGARYEVLDTGEDTETGERLLRAREHLLAGTFCLTYVDGLSDIDLSRELEFHREHGKLATVALVKPRLQWGVARLEGPEVTGFVEKPTSTEWINGGFLCLEPGVFDWLEAGESLEAGLLERLASQGQLMGYRHDGFWDCVDTYKDLVEVNDLWERGEASWLPPS
jgi:glucose-1-phosphate cytidylyltransferase